MLTREDILHLMDEMIDYQRRKVLEIAREAIPGVTEEDLRNPHDFPVLNASARFNYEDGILTGYLGAKMALLNEINRKS